MPEGEWAPWLAVGHGAVWISVARLSRPELDGTGLVVRVDSSTNAAVASIPVGRSPEGVAFTPDAVWVANHRSDATPAAASGTFTVSRVDPVANREIARVPVEVRQHSDPWIRFCCGPESAAAGAGSVWTGDAWAHSVLRIDPATNSVTARIEIADGDACGGMAADDAAVWIASGCDSFTLGRIDPATNGLTLIQLPGVAQDVALGLGSVWATTGSTTRSPGEVALVRVDPATNAVVGRTTVTGAGTLAVGGGAVWVTTGPELVRIEPAG
jgi:YVTN family beta-propeller protein